MYLRRRKDNSHDVSAQADACLSCFDCVKALKFGAGAYLQLHLVDKHKLTPTFSAQVITELFKRHNLVKCGRKG